MSHRHRGHLETAPPFTVPCEGREVRFKHCSHRESNPGSSRGSLLHNRCAMPAPQKILFKTCNYNTCNGVTMYNKQFKLSAKNTKTRKKPVRESVKKSQLNSTCHMSSICQRILFDKL